MKEAILRIGDPWFGAQLGQLVREARALIGWSQAELADRSGTSQATISRLESGDSGSLAIGTVLDVLESVGFRADVSIDAPHLRDRTRQRDPVHARLVGYVARRLERAGWRVATEVPIGDRAPRGWIDVLAFRPTDRAGLVGEIKGDLPDVGGLQRQVGLYERSAAWAARSLGWQFERIAILVAALDSSAVGRRIDENRALIDRAFPGRTRDLEAWIASGAGPAPAGHTIALIDPGIRAGRWLRRPSPSRIAKHPFVDYADAAAKLRRRR
jgi:transcriptional regulator with XRE-family HTH domain